MVPFKKGETIPRPPFDLELAEVEATNFSRTMQFHLSRCDDAQAAEKFSEMFQELSVKFKQKADLLKGKFK